MGQNSSQLQEEEGYAPQDDGLKQDQSHNHHLTSDDLVFSSQVHSSINPTLLPPHHPSNAKYSSSPASRLHSSQASTPIPSYKMSHLSPMQSSPAFSSSMDLGAQADEYNPFPSMHKKKKRSKKQQGPASDLDQDHRTSAPHSSIDLSTSVYGSEQHQHGIMDGDVDINTTPGSSLSQSQRKKEKRERKESRRAAKLAKQQQLLAASSPLENTEEPSRYAEMWESQERTMAAKREHREEEEEEEPKTHIEEPAEPQNEVSKKRKRKYQNKAEDTPEQSSKRRKDSHSSTGGIVTEHDRATHNDSIEGPEASSNGDINFNDLAEQLYSGRKRRSHGDTIGEESGLVIEAELEHEEPARITDISGQMEENLSGNGLGEGEVTDDVEMYQGADIDHAYNTIDGANMALEAPSTDHLITTDQLSSSARDSNGLTYDTHNDGLVITGTEQSMNAGVDPSHIGDNAYEYVEIPSSVPHNTSAGELSAKRSTTTKSSTGRKRVAKPDFFTRLMDEMDENVNVQSPSTPASSRRKYKGKGKEISTSEDEAKAGPSTAKRKVRKPKITSMLDGDVAVTPSTESVVRMRTPKTPVTLAGAFSDFEIRNLSQAIERFRDDYTMTQHQVNELIHSNPKESRAGELWERIMATCPGRSRQKVINQTRRRFHNFVARGTWTPEQEQELRQMYEQYGNKYALIGQLINRHPEDIRDRIRNYIICGDKLKKDQWSQEEADQLIAIVEQASAEISRQRALRGENTDLPIEEDINWQMVSQGMGRTRSRLQCIAKWKAIKPQLTGGGLDGETATIEEIIQQARETATTMSYRNRSFVVKEILKTGANADSRIPWLKLRHELGGQWTRPPLMIVWFRLKRTIPNWQSLNVKEICTFLLQHFQQTHQLEYPTDESGDLDYNVEYREIEYKIKRGRKSNLAPKSAAFISKASDDEDEDEDEGEEEEEVKTDEAIRDKLDTTGEVEVEASQRSRPDSIDLGIGNGSEKVREVEDSEPEADTRRRRRHPRRTRSGGARSGPQDMRQGESDDQSSDTNASQVSSIPAR
ncbi:hypothetical protein F4825DRAFT_51165 [Nemania diffusa]|nr:hypothetical protein F4825DRAFT_51165 [Nemania diffusa]